jgi:hypothetical protein
MKAKPTLDESSFAAPDLGLYILGPGKTTVHVDNALEWAQWRLDHRAELRIGGDVIAGSYFVSTVFVGIDQNMAAFFGGSGEPVLFETMVITTLDNGERAIIYQKRCSTWIQAERQHVDALAVFNRVARG